MPSVALGAASKAIVAPGRKERLDSHWRWMLPWWSRSVQYPVMRSKVEPCSSLGVSLSSWMWTDAVRKTLLMVFFLNVELGCYYTLIELFLTSKLEAALLPVSLSGTMSEDLRFYAGLWVVQPYN